MPNIDFRILFRISFIFLGHRPGAGPWPVPWLGCFIFVAIYSERWSGHHFCIVYTAFGDNGFIFCCYLLGLVNGYSLFVAIYMTWWTRFHVLLLFARVRARQTKQINKTTVKTSVLARFRDFWHYPKSFISLPTAMKWMISGGCKKYKNTQKPQFLQWFYVFFEFDDRQPL